MADLGSDIGGIFDVDATLSVVTGRTALAHAILGRLTTVKGSTIDAPTLGYDVTQLIGSTVPPSVVEQRVLEQVLDEEEVLDATVSVTLSSHTLRIEIRVTDSDGPFLLTFAATELSLAAFIDGEKLEELPLAA